MRSYTKRAGFTGVRCAYTVDAEASSPARRRAGERVPLRELWARRQATKFNGVPYVVQRAAAAVLLARRPQADAASRSRSTWRTRSVLREGLGAAGFAVFGGVHAPYIWMRTPDGLTSWEFFDRLLARSPRRRHARRGLRRRPARATCGSPPSTRATNVERGDRAHPQSVRPAMIRQLPWPFGVRPQRATPGGQEA